MRRSPTAVAPPTKRLRKVAIDQDPAAVASEKYFSSVNQYFEDLRDKEPQRIAQYGVWFDKYARKIDQLPMVNVDSEMLTYGAYVAQQLRNAATAIQGIGIRSRVRQVDAADAGGVTPGYYGGNYNGGYAVWWELLLRRQRVRAGRLRPGRLAAAADGPHAGEGAGEGGRHVDSPRHHHRKSATPPPWFAVEMTEKYKVEF